MATPLGPKHNIFIDIAPKFDNPSKLGSKTNRIHFYKKDGEALPEKFAIAVASNKTVGDANLVLEKSFFDKVYKKFTGHDRWVAVNVGTSAKPQYLKVNYNSMQERLFNAADKILKKYEKLPKSTPIVKKDYTTLLNIRELIEKLTGGDTLVISPELAKKVKDFNEKTKGILPEA